MTSVVSINAWERSVAAEFHARHIDPTRWLCSNVCTALMGTYDVYIDRFHITGVYAKYLEVVLGHALGFPLAS